MNPIRRLRDNLGLSADQAARRAGISTSMWIKVERGERTPSLLIARKIAVALGCTLDDIFLPSDSTQGENETCATREAANQ